MNPVKAWFLGRLLREKVLVLAFVLLGALIWLSSATDSLSANLRTARAAQAELDTQALWLSNRESIEQMASEAARHLEPSKTYDATALVSAVQNMARNAGLPVNIDAPRTGRSAQFAIHTVKATTRRAELAAVLRFYQELSSRAPYLGLKEISVQGDRSAPGMVNVSFDISSVELQGEAAAAATSSASAPKVRATPVAPVAPPAAPAAQDASPAGAPAPAAVPPPVEAAAPAAPEQP